MEKHGEETVSLRFKEFDDHFSETFDFLFANFSDVTLVSEDGMHFKAHRAVLCSVSQLFKSILSNHTQENPVVYFNGTDKEEIKTMLDLMYTGSASYIFQRTEAIQSILEQLQLKENVDNFSVR